MRKLLIGILSLVSLNAFSYQQISEGTIGLSYIDGVVKSIRPLCPPSANGMSCMAIGTNVTVEFTLLGCMDELITTSYVRALGQGEYELYITAQNVHKSLSKDVMCFQAPTKRVTFFIQDNATKVKVKFLGVKAQDYY